MKQIGKTYATNYRKKLQNLITKKQVTRIPSSLEICQAKQTYSAPWTQDVNSMYIRRSEDVQDVWWTSYVRSIYVLSSKDNISNNVDYKSSYSNECTHCKYVSIYQHACIYQHFHCSVVCLVLHSNVFFCFSLEIWDGTFCENSFH